MGYDDKWLIAHRDIFQSWNELTDEYNKTHGVNYTKSAIMTHCKRRFDIKIGTPHKYDDEWIIERWQTVRNWLTLCNQYNKEHKTNLTYTTFKSYCNRSLELNYHYTEEQLEWLKENYPSLGRIKTAKLFNEIFNEKKSPQAIKCQCLRMGLKVNKGRKYEIPPENTGRIHPIGTIRPMAHGEPYIKNNDGNWEPLKHTVIEAKEGQIIVFLDGDCKNISKENLMHTTRAVSARMTANKFWSTHPEITKTGIICCELEQVLSGGNNE